MHNEKTRKEREPLTQYLWEAYLDGDFGLVMTDHGQGDGESIYELTNEERATYGVNWSHAILLCLSNGARSCYEGLPEDIATLEKEIEDLVSLHYMD